MSPFKNSQGVLLLGALFFELAENKDTVIYTLKDEDHEGYPSLYLLYMGLEDILEYEFANQYLHSWNHWERLCDTTWFKPVVQRWRKELDLKLKSRALVSVIKEATSTGRNAFMASKYLLERGWEPKLSPTQRKAERAEKDEVKVAAKKQLDDEKKAQEDLARVQAGGT